MTPSAAGQYLVIDAVDVLGTLVGTPPPPSEPPTITSVTSSSGPTADGATVVIKGTGFTGLSGASAVLFGSTPAASLHRELSHADNRRHARARLGKRGRLCDGCRRDKLDQRGRFVHLHGAL